METVAGTRSVVHVDSRADVERSRREIRRLALALGFDRDDAERVVLAGSELATNLLRYARDGRIVASAVVSTRTGILIESHDSGPGIADVELAIGDGYSTGGGLGGGLPAVYRLMDEVRIESGPSGTHVTARKWLTAPS